MAQWRHYFWPSIVDATSAIRASRQGIWASCFCAGATIFFVLLGVFGVRGGFDILSLVDASMFIVIGWGIYKMNRFAAVSGLALYILERIIMWSQYGPKNPAMAIILTLMFINSARGIFGYHKLTKTRNGAASGDQL